MGLIVNLPKSSLEPEQIFVFLGIQLDLLSFLCRPSEDRWNRLQKILARFLANRFMSARQWQALIGSLVSMDSQVPLGRLHRRPLQHALAARWSKDRSLREPVPVLPEDKVHLQWWTCRENVMAGKTLQPFQAQVTLYTDSSKSGWGAHVGDQTVSGLWSEQEARLHINWLELEAIRLALLHFQHLVEHKHVLIMCDNKTAVAYLNKEGGTRSHSLTALKSAFYYGASP